MPAKSKPKTITWDEFVDKVDKLANKHGLMVDCYGSRCIYIEDDLKANFECKSLKEKD